MEAYGPFDARLIERCVAQGGGNACYMNRWNASFLRGLLRQL